MRWTLWSLVLVVLGCANGTRPVGSECTSKDECVDGLCLQAVQFGEATGWTAGYCTAPCSEGSCPSGSRCEVVGDAQYCLAICAALADCRDGYVCPPGLGACVPDCRDGFSCGEGYSCGDDGWCVSDEAVSKLGEPCSADAQCLTGICFEEATTATGVTWTDGTCTQYCTGCPDGTGCMNFGTEAWCLPSCDEESSCREGYVCGGDDVCLPDCRLGFECGDALDCGADGRCGGVAAGTCTADEDCGDPALACSDAGFCLPILAVPCSSELDCTDGFRCSPEGICVPDLPGSCSNDDDCIGTDVCAPNGFCAPDVVATQQTCTSNVDCAAWCPPFASGGCLCVELTDDVQACRVSCETDADCQPPGGAVLAQCDPERGFCVATSEATSA